MPAASGAWTLTGHSRALERTGFVIEELRIFLDAGSGWRDVSPNPEAILVTHGHIDHINALPMLMRCVEGAEPAIFVPFLHLNNVREMCRLTWSVKRTDAGPHGGIRDDFPLEWGAGWLRNEVLPAMFGGGICAASASGSATCTNRSIEPKPQEFEWPELGLPLAQGALRDGQAPGAGVPTGGKKWLSTRGSAGPFWVASLPGMQYALPNSKAGIVVRTVHCFHTVTDLGYIICSVAKSQRGATEAADAEFCKLKEGMKSGSAEERRAGGKRLAEMRKQNLLVNVEEVVPRVAYLLDTTAQVFGPCAACSRGGAAAGSAEEASCLYAEHNAFGSRCNRYLGACSAGGVANTTGEELSLQDWAAGLHWQENDGLRLLAPDAETAADIPSITTNPNNFGWEAQRRTIFACATIIVECSFIAAGGMPAEQADAEALKRGHASWTQLQPHVAAHPASVFVLTHFSKRYSDGEIADYFKVELAGTCLSNVVLWLDSGIVDFSMRA